MSTDTNIGMIKMTLVLLICAIGLFHVVNSTIQRDVEMERRRKAIDAQLEEQNEYLGKHDHDQCIEKMVCTIASLPDSELHARMHNNPLTFLANLSLDMQENGKNNEALQHISQFEHLEELRKAAEYGHSVQNSHQCEKHYSDCLVNHEAIMKLLDMFSNVDKLATKSSEQIIEELSETQTFKRDLQESASKLVNTKRGCNKTARIATCSSLGILCPGFAVACGLCAIFTGGTCAFGCGPALAAVCAGTAAACAVTAKYC